MKEKKAFFLSHKDGKEFFDEAKQKIGIFVSIGHTKLYREKIKKFGIAFKNIPEELKKFLTSCEKQVLNLVNPQETTFSAIKVHQALDISHVNRYLSLHKKDDSHIFTSLENLLIPNSLIETFRSKSNNLLIIECKPIKGEDTQEYDQLAEIVRSNDNKKVVLITQKDDALAKKFKDFFNKYKEINETTLMTLLVNPKQNYKNQKLYFREKRRT